MKHLERLQIIWTVLFFSILISHSAAQGDDGVSERHFGLANLRDPTEVLSPRVSPNAKSIVVVVSWLDYEENRYAIYSFDRPIFRTRG